MATGACLLHEVKQYIEDLYKALPIQRCIVERSEDVRGENGRDGPELRWMTKGYVRWLLDEYAPPSPRTLAARPSTPDVPFWPAPTPTKSDSGDTTLREQRKARQSGESNGNGGSQSDGPGAWRASSRRTAGQQRVR